MLSLEEFEGGGQGEKGVFRESVVLYTVYLAWAKADGRPSFVLLLES